MPSEKRILIIGGGLSGLTLAYLLSQQQINADVLEASSRIGGRIQTIQGPLGTPLELGATWFNESHSRLLALLDTLDLKKHPQVTKGTSLFQTSNTEPIQKFSVPEEENQSYRIVGGTQQLIEALIQKLDPNQIKLNSKVIQIKMENDGLKVGVSTGELIAADLVVVCLPPQATASEIQFSPTLPDPMPQLLPLVQTWMGGSIKFVLEFEEPFWKKSGYSGMAFSHVGIIAEIYDHSNEGKTKFGFTGFLNATASRLSLEERQGLVLRHLGELLEEKIPNPSIYQDKIWTDRLVLGANPIIQRPHQYHGHPLLLQSYYHEKLFFAGTETSTEYAGYMEGAIRSAERVAQQILKEKG
ncbi:NAD(P)/FAD-dependent oxidoreductase [Algoriphagus sp. CAU 1675]|uniref:flavin monoamine oxidase family protein n=1 Tax=Algoriphagus sp. CAU 1675 TaxID=3032597 RepID=UPI0023DCDCFB|nr:NAD(P)/FAD-dependent oxidoreductase [Algoriphagus sp. CAU 1675]MDF2157507.1 NAD(P)/FAD-dependent oxidoreductase [Algoriphagus sp. CAU 1675]